MFADSSVRADMLQLPYKVEADRFGRVCIRVSYKGELRTAYPEEIAAHVLSKLRVQAETYLAEPVRDAVVTVPAYFNDSQRQATREAAQLAGLNVLRILNEPTAAALAYGLAQGPQGAEEEQTVLIFDFGGGTLDVSVLNIDSGIFEVRSTAGNTHLGGADFDSRLVGHVLRECARSVLQADGAGVDALVQTMRADATWLRRVREACEQAKCELSASDQTEMKLQLRASEAAKVQQDSVLVSVTRSQFEKLCADLFRACMEPVRRALQDARLEPARIDRAVLVGGASRMPQIRQSLAAQFGFKDACIHDSVDPDIAIAYGAGE